MEATQSATSNQRMRPLIGNRLKSNKKQFLIRGAKIIHERHRHRFEVNPVYHEQLQACGLVFAGTNEAGDRIEAVEVADHPWFVATQFHPEFKSQPLDPHPLFRGFIGAAIQRAGVQS